MPEIIIVGSGAAGTAAALELAGRGIRPLMLDVGHGETSSLPPVTENLYDYRRHHDSFDLLIGADFRGVADVLTDRVGIAKLNAPNMAFVTQDAGRLGPVEALNFDPEFCAGRAGERLGGRALPLHRRRPGRLPHRRGGPGAILRPADRRDRHQRGR
jgi:choline dehydrogenase-like flavoprotein